MLKSILRGLLVFLVGLCLVVWSNQAGVVLLKALGIFMILSAVVTVVYGLATNSFQDFKGMSIITIASALLFTIVGLMLLLKTDFFMQFIGFVLGFLLALYGLLQLILAGISDDGKISAEAKKALLARIEEGKARDFINPMGEVKRQLRCKLGPVEGKKIADAVDKLW